jgi:hypothetical protein
MPLHESQAKFSLYGTHKKAIKALGLYGIIDKIFEGVKGGSDINENMELMVHDLESYAVASGRHAGEVGVHSVKRVLLRMQKNDDELTMVYGRRTRKQLGR